MNHLAAQGVRNRGHIAAAALPSRVSDRSSGLGRGEIGLATDGAPKRKIVAEQLFAFDHVLTGDDRGVPGQRPWSTA